jgi:hypothetical protein
VTALRIWWFKRKARRAYLAWHDVMGEMSCGIALGSFISGRAQRYARDFNDAMDRLAAIDPKTPVFRING